MAFRLNLIEKSHQCQINSDRNIIKHDLPVPGVKLSPWRPGDSGEAATHRASDETIFSTAIAVAAVCIIRTVKIIMTKRGAAHALSYKVNNTGGLLHH